MRVQGTSLFIFAIALVLGEGAHAQSSQYQRPGKKKEVAAPAVAAPTGKNAKNEKKAESPSDKVDISDLEQKYWAPKDVEFSVVQNRLYSKAGRFAITPHLGPLVTDSFSTGPVWGLSGNYYFSERYGVEVTYDKYQLENSVVYESFLQENRTSPDFNRQEDYYGAAFNWIPIYAKISLLDQRIMYFDMSFSPGIGLMTYTQQLEGGDGNTIVAPALSLDIAQHYFLSKELAIRIDMRNRLYKDEVVKYRKTSTFNNKGDFVKERLNHSITIQFGLTFYFGG